VDVGATLFNPKRSAAIEGNLAGANGQYSGNGREYFVLPEFAINKKVNDSVALGLAIYGNGGMNTTYKRNPYAAFGNTGEAGVDLSQVYQEMQMKR
jgi:long-chain fatty acid transport protein